MPLTENEVIEALASHLRRAGWKILKKSATNQRGIDIIASKPRASGRLLVEAKGGTSSKDGTKRFGLGFNGGQVISHVAGTFYCVAKLQALHPRDTVAIALPDDARHRAAVASIGAALDKLSVRVYLIGGDRKIGVWRCNGPTSNLR